MSLSASPTSRHTAAAVLGALLRGVAGRGGGASDAVPNPGTTGGGVEPGDSSWASPVDQQVVFAESLLTEGSAPPPGEPLASDDDSDFGTPGRTTTTGMTPVQTRG
jgi:hypothetical protein